MPKLKPDNASRPNNTPKLKPDNASRPNNTPKLKPGNASRPNNVRLKRKRNWLDYGH